MLEITDIAAPSQRIAEQLTGEIKSVFCFKRGAQRIQGDICRPPGIDRLEEDRLKRIEAR
jgi:hypothetical protein